MNDERQQAAASYIIDFYQNITALNNFYSAYLNTTLELQTDKENEDTNKIQLKQTLQNLRYYTHKSYLMANTIASSVNIKLDKSISENYNLMKSQYVIETEALESFIIELNKFLIQDIIKTLLENSQQYVSTIFDNE